jgi:hypothetical protein
MIEYRGEIRYEVRWYVKATAGYLHSPPEAEDVEFDAWFVKYGEDIAPVPDAVKRLIKCDVLRDIKLRGAI